MFVRLSVAVFLLSFVSCVFGASVSVNATELDKNSTNLLNSTNLDNSTKALNGTTLEIREADFVKLNASDSSLNSTSNSTHLNGTMKLEVREAADDKLMLHLGNSSMAGNSSMNLNDTMKLNETMKIDNVTTRAVNSSVNSLNSTHNATGSLWDALPLFRDLNSSLHNSSLRNSSENVNASKPLRAVDSVDNFIGNDDMAAKNGSALNSTEVESMEGGVKDVSEDIVDGSTMKPCSTVSCLISRGCSDDSCSQNDN